MTLIPENVYTDKLHYIVNKYNNIYHRTIIWALLMSNQAHTLNLV